MRYKQVYLKYFSEKEMEGVGSTGEAVNGARRDIRGVNARLQLCGKYSYTK